MEDRLNGGQGHRQENQVGVSVTILLAPRIITLGQCDAIS